MAQSGAFHVVAKHYNDVLRGHEVYCNNRPCIRSFAGERIPRSQARRIAAAMNRITRMKFVPHPEGHRQRRVPRS